MRVKLSYTVEEEEVLKEAANLVGLASPAVQQVLDFFSSIQAELRGDGSQDGVVNVPRAVERIGKMRDALLSVDLRLGEVSEIIEGYEEHQRTDAPLRPELSQDGPSRSQEDES